MNEKERASPLGSAWSRFVKTLPVLGPAEAERARTCFYSGATAIFNLLTNAVSPGAEVTERELLAMETVAEELKAFEMEPPGQRVPDPIWQQSGVNLKGDPFVQLLLGQRVIGQLSPETAREHGRACIEAAECAESDAFMMYFLQQKVGIDFNRAGQVLMDFRRYREGHTGKHQGPTQARDWVMPDGVEPPEPGGAGWPGAGAGS